MDAGIILFIVCFVQKLQSLEDISSKLGGWTEYIFITMTSGWRRCLQIFWMEIASVFKQRI